MLTLRHITHTIGGRFLYEDVNFHIKENEKMALVGDNGTGKSTLFKIMAGEISPSQGSVNRDKKTTLGYYNQDLLSYETTNTTRAVVQEAFAEARDLQTKIEEILKKMESDTSAQLIEALGDLQERFSEIGGYEMDTQTEEMLGKLGFTPEQLDAPFNDLSGGWRMRALFAKLLLEKPSLLLLDEPTNHLDIVSIEWVENYLRKYDRSYVVISHDQRFLDAITTKTVAIENENLTTYHGNYTYYLEEKVRRQEIQQSQYENQQREIKHTEKFITRFRSNAKKSTLVQSRVKSLAKIERIESPKEKKRRIFIRWDMKKKPGREVVKIEEMSKAFPPKTLFNKASISIERGDKIALIGENGKGKTSLLKLITGHMAVDAGKITLGHQVMMEYHAQHQLEGLDPKATPLDTIREVIPDGDEPEIRAILGAFLFRKDDVFKKVSVLSGGEKARLSLAKTLAKNPNFLVLDEPTNHLDIGTIHSLTQALASYPGTLLFVSHDRHFIQQIANKIWYIEDHKVEHYPGTYDEYKDWELKMKDKG